MKGRKAFLPCPRGACRCRYYQSLHWWSWAGLAWADYLWVEYGQYGERP